MAKKRLIEKDIPVTFNLSDVVMEDYIQTAVDRSVSAAIEHAVNEAVEKAVSDLVNEIGKARVAKEVDRVLGEGWPRTNDYGEAKGPNVTLKERISKILEATDRYSSRGSWIDERVKEHVNETLNKTLKPEIDAAKNKFKAEVDAVLTATIREALAKNLGLKA